MEKHCAEAEHPSNLNPQFPGSATPSGRPTRTPSSESTPRLTKDRPQAGTENKASLTKRGRQLSQLLTSSGRQHSCITQ